MLKTGKFLFIVFFLMAGNYAVRSCEIDYPPLRKEFRTSKYVFVGKVIAINDPTGSAPKPKDRQIHGTITFHVDQSWKGGKATEVSLYSNVGASGCGPFDYFRKDETYLVFAENSYVHFLSATKLDQAKNKIKRLDDFWFRTWARVFPF